MHVFATYSVMLRHSRLTMLLGQCIYVYIYIYIDTHTHTHKWCVFRKKVSLCFIIHTIGSTNVIQSLKKHKKTKHCDNCFLNLVKSLAIGTVYQSLRKRIACESGTKVRSRTCSDAYSELCQRWSLSRNS